MRPVRCACVHLVTAGRIEYQMSGAGEGFPARADEKVSIVPSLLMNGRASKPGLLSPRKWIAEPKAANGLRRLAV
jgi:hypothetical protein